MKPFCIIVVIISLSFFCYSIGVSQQIQQISKSAELKDLYPLVESFKANLHAVAWINHKVDYVMDGTVYFKKPAMSRSEIQWSRNGDTSNILITFDGRYEWQYYKEFKSAIREDVSLQKNELKKMYGFLPLYSTNANITYLGKETFKGEVVRKYIVVPPHRLKDIAPTIGAKREFFVGEQDGVMRAVNFYDAHGQLEFSEEFTVISTNEYFKNDFFSLNLGKDVVVNYK